MPRGAKPDVSDPSSPLPPGEMPFTRPASTVHEGRFATGKHYLDMRPLGEETEEERPERVRVASLA